MTLEEQAQIILLIGKELWPGKFQPEELSHFVESLGKYMHYDVVAALKQHHETQPFRPKLNQMLAVLRGKQHEEGKAESKERSWVECIRDQVSHWMPAAREMADDEIVFRYYRQLYWRFKRQADKQTEHANDAVRQQVADALARRKTSLARECCNSLMGAGMEDSRAMATAGWIDCQYGEIGTAMGTEVNWQDAIA